MHVEGVGGHGGGGGGGWGGENGRGCLVTSTRAVVMVITNMRVETMNRVSTSAQTIDADEWYLLGLPCMQKPAGAAAACSHCAKLLVGDVLNTMQAPGVPHVAQLFV